MRFFSCSILEFCVPELQKAFFDCPVCFVDVYQALFFYCTSTTDFYFQKTERADQLLGHYSEAFVRFCVCVICHVGRCSLTLFSASPPNRCVISNLKLGSLFLVQLCLHPRCLLILVCLFLHSSFLCHAGSLMLQKEVLAFFSTGRFLPFCWPV